jgi:hypothetical protein
MYYTKYFSTFASVRGNITRVEIEAPDFYGLRYGTGNAA